MSTYKQGNRPEIKSVDQLRDGLIPPLTSTPGRMGIEWELLPCGPSGELVSYYSGGGISDIFSLLSAAGYPAQLEDGRPIGLDAPRGQFVGLEPGGQIEISTPPRESLSELGTDLEMPLREFRGLTMREGWAPEAWGIAPRNHPEDLPDVPKARYTILAEHLRSRGTLGRWMMKLTAATQFSIDVLDERSVPAHIHGALKLLPCLVGWLANSPVSALEIGGQKTQRPSIWLGTDPGRCGLPPFLFGGGDLVGGFLEYALGRETLFFVRDGVWLKGGGKTFLEWLRDPGPLGPLTMDDWLLHNSSIFTDIRFRGYLEIRVADSVPLDLVLGAGALCKGLLSEPGRIADWGGVLPEPDPSDTPAAIGEAAGMGGAWPGGPGREDVTRRLFDAARIGLAALGEEPGFLDPLEKFVAGSTCPADLWKWSGGSVSGPSALGADK